MKNVQLKNLTIEKLKLGYSDSDFWKIKKENEFPFICLVFFEIQKRKNIDITFEEFIRKYNIKRKQETSEIDTLMKALIKKFYGLGRKVLKYQNENETQDIFNATKIIRSLNLTNHEKVLQLLSSESFFERVRFFEYIFYLLACYISEIEDPSEENILYLYKCAGYYYEYIYRFIELPIGLHSLKKVEVTEIREDLLDQFLILYHDLREKQNFMNSIKNFFYLNFLYEPDIKTVEYELRSKDIKRLLFSKRKNGNLHPQLVAQEVLKKVNEDMYNSLKGDEIKYFIQKLLDDLKDGKMTRLCVLFIFFLIDFGFKMLYNIKNWYNKSVRPAYKGKIIKTTRFPVIYESGINEWCVVHTKKDKNNFNHKKRKMYFSYKEKAFEKVITKYFSILGEFNLSSFRWEKKREDVSSFLNYDLMKHKDKLKKNDDIEILEDLVVVETSTSNESPNNNLFAEMYEKVKNLK